MNQLPGWNLLSLRDRQALQAAPELLQPAIPRPPSLQLGYGRPCIGDAYWTSRTALQNRSQCISDVARVRLDQDLAEANNEDATEALDMLRQFLQQAILPMWMSDFNGARQLRTDHQHLLVRVPIIPRHETEYIDVLASGTQTTTVFHGTSLILLPSNRDSDLQNSPMVFVVSGST